MEGLPILRIIMLYNPIPKSIYNVIPIKILMPFFQIIKKLKFMWKHTKIKNQIVKAVLSKNNNIPDSKLYYRDIVKKTA